jgi:hypothetical protein
MAWGSWTTTTKTGEDLLREEEAEKQRKKLPWWLRSPSDTVRYLSWDFDDDELDREIDRLGGPPKRLDEFKRRVHAWRDSSDSSWDELESLAADIVALAAEAIYEREHPKPGAGWCVVCGRAVDGSNPANRLHTLPTTRTKACNACRVSWGQEMKREDADFNRWWDKRRCRRCPGSNSDQPG